MQCITLKAYAKINAGLAVLGRRDDGYHELRTIYQSISLADIVSVSLSSGGRGAHRGTPAVSLEARGYPVPDGRGNLAVRAAEALLTEIGLRRHVLLSLHKRIPPGSGLGGASSDAAAVLQALLLLSGKTLPPERLRSLASDLGSDVPFFLMGGRALGVGRGEEIYPLPETPRRSLVVVFPAEGMSTAEAYRLLHARPLTALRARLTIELFGARAAEASVAIGNDFEPLLFRKFPELAKVKRQFLLAGAEAAALSGSGSAVFGLFQEVGTARAARQQLAGKGFRVFLARTVSRREYQSQLRSAPMPGRPA